MPFQFALRILLTNLALLQQSNDPDHRFSVANFAKFHEICEILWHYYPEIPYILRPGVKIRVARNTAGPANDRAETCMLCFIVHY